METPKKPSTFDAKAVESLPEKPVTQHDAGAIKGGGIIRRVSGGDDDLEDLEVER